MHAKPSYHCDLLDRTPPEVVEFLHSCVTDCSSASPSHFYRLCRCTVCKVTQSYAFKMTSEGRYYALLLRPRSTRPAEFHRSGTVPRHHKVYPTLQSWPDREAIRTRARWTPRERSTYTSRHQQAEGSADLRKEIIAYERSRELVAKATLAYCLHRVRAIVNRWREMQRTLGSQTAHVMLIGYGGSARDCTSC